MNIDNLHITPESRFEKAMNDMGLFPEGPIIADGRIQRFATSDKRRDDAGWYVLHPGSPFWGSFGCHRDGTNGKWRDDPALYTTDPADYRENLSAKEETSVATQLDARDRAFTTWLAANDSPDSHPYLVRKNVGAYGVRRSGDNLYIPIYNKDHELSSLLTIQPDGKKRFLRGGSTAGGFHLIGEPNSTICIAEGYATAASIHEATGYAVYVAFSANNLRRVAQYARGVNFNAQIIVCADDDNETKGNPGLKKAREAAISIGGRLAIPFFGPKRPASATDFNDLMAIAGSVVVCQQISGAIHPAIGETGENGNTLDARHDPARQRSGDAGDEGKALRKAQIAAAVEKASEIILADLAPSIEYPIDALGPLADVCHVIAKGAQVDPAIVGQSLLGAASLLAQSVANVRAAESTKPLSLYLLTIANSGDGKSTVESIVLQAINQHQRQEQQEYDLEMEAYRLETKNTGKKDPDPIKPVQPYRLMRDATVEGIRRSYEEGVPSQGVFTSEAAAMLHGYGMSSDHRAKTAANLNALWDGGELSVARVTGERVQLYDRRFAMHWMIQPTAAAQGLDDQLLIEIGLWPRFLVAWPSPGAPRTFSLFDAGKELVIGGYWARCTQLLNQPLGESCADLPVVYPNPDALKFFAAYFEDTERRAKTKTGDLTEARAFAARATEQAFRIAGVLTVYGGEKSVDTSTAQNAIRLVNYSLQNWLAIRGDRGDNEHRLYAVKLYRWLLLRQHFRSDITSILRNGPRCVRSRSRRDTALAILRHAGLIGFDKNEVQGVLPPAQPKKNANDRPIDTDVADKSPVKKRD